MLLYRYPFSEEIGNRFNAAKLDQYLYSYFGDALCNIRLNLLENPRFISTLKKENDPDAEGENSAKKPSRTWKYLNATFKESPRIAVESVFTLPKSRKKRNSRIMFKFAGAIPVPEMGLKKKRFDAKYSQYVDGKEAKERLVMVGKFRKICRIRPYSSVHLPVGCIYSVL